MSSYMSYSTKNATDDGNRAAFHLSIAGLILNDSIFLCNPNAVE
jgi:hypothetical protein